MKTISDIIDLSYRNGIYLLSIDTTRSNIMGCESNLNLNKIISDWDQYRPFADKYGLVLTSWVEEFVSIFVLSQLLKEFKLICHPDEQDKNSSLNNLNLQTTSAKWIYKTCIFYDREYNYTVDFEEFRESSYFPQFKWSDFIKTVNGNFISRIVNKIKFVHKQFKSHVLASTMYYLLNPRHVHQAVICGGNSDVYKCPNYIGYKTEMQESKIIEILNNTQEPNLDKILDYANFYAIDFKGEDIGYARLLKIYSKSDLHGILRKLEESFEPFIVELKKMFSECETLEKFENRMNLLLEENL